MRFLIDECLHTSLTHVANKGAHEAHHVTRRGWSGFKDHQLREVVLREEFVFATNNARAIFVTPAVQREPFDRALQKVSELSDMINKVVEVDLDEVRVYELPRLEQQRLGARLAPCLRGAHPPI